MHDVIIVGGGLFGSVLARHLYTQGMSVALVDDHRPERGSDPAGCVIKPSWVSSMSRIDLDAGLGLLHQYYTVKSVDFQVLPSKLKTTAYRVEPSSILTLTSTSTRFTVVRSRVHSIIDHGPCATVVLPAGPAMTLQARWVVVAAGIWTPELCPWVETWGRWGWAFRAMPVYDPVISLWAPYKQVVAFNMDDGMSWAGDGSALVEKSFRQPYREQSARQRVERIVGKTTTTLSGVRPYASLVGRDPCMVSPRGRVIALTGGAKNGTIAAAWAARRIEGIVT